jgi:hypothetical protein
MAGPGYQPLGPAFIGKIHAPLYSGTELSLARLAPGFLFNF